MRPVPFALVLAVAVALVGCGGQAGAAQTPVETTNVNLPPSYRFDPVVIRVPAGATVTWRNSDHFTHSVKVMQGDFPFLNLPPGQSGNITFDQPGEYDYVCTYHSQDMKGKVVVTTP